MVAVGQRDMQTTLKGAANRAILFSLVLPVYISKGYAFNTFQLYQ